jgi:RNA polymerase sigma-70 factor (ECF subfamily)
LPADPDDKDTTLDIVQSHMTASTGTTAASAGTEPPLSAFASELVALLPRLRRFTLSLTRSASEADDLAQATCERALKAQALWQPGTRLDAWLFRIARNLWIDSLRKRRSEGQSEALEDHLDLAGEDGRHVGDVALTVDSVQQALGAMPSDHRELLMMVCVDGKSYREASQQLSIPLGTVMSRLSRARQGLAAKLGMDKTS